MAPRVMAPTDVMTTTAAGWGSLTTDMGAIPAPQVNITWPSGAGMDALITASRGANGAFQLHLLAHATTVASAAGAYLNTDAQNSMDMKKVGEAIGAFTGPAKDLMGSAQSLTQAVAQTGGQVLQTGGQLAQNLASMLGQFGQGTGTPHAVETRQL